MLDVPFSLVNSFCANTIASKPATINPHPIALPVLFWKLTGGILRMVLRLRDQMPDWLIKSQLLKLCLLN